MSVSKRLRDEAKAEALRGPRRNLREVLGLPAPTYAPRPGDIIAGRDEHGTPRVGAYRYTITGRHQPHSADPAPDAYVIRAVVPVVGQPDRERLAEVQITSQVGPAGRYEADQYAAALARVRAQRAEAARALRDEVERLSAPRRERMDG